MSSIIKLNVFHISVSLGTSDSDAVCRLLENKGYSCFASLSVWTKSRLKTVADRFYGLSLGSSQTQCSCSLTLLPLGLGRELEE